MKRKPFRMTSKGRKLSALITATLGASGGLLAFAQPAPTTRPTDSPPATQPSSAEIAEPTRLPEPAAAEDPGVRLPEVVVRGRSESLVGTAETASEGYVGRDQLELRPLLRPGEVLETVPGVVITQHSGAGKANQFFLRGFNLDHGTDLATSVAGLPVNLPSHAHGQGYSDLNFLIPELVSDINYRKGVYYADEGDFASAGAIHINYIDTLPKALAVVEGGSFGYARGLFADSQPLGDGNLLYAFEYFHDDGPWKVPSAYWKTNAVLRYSQGDKDNGGSVTALGYYGDWTSTDQVAERAIDTGLIDRFGSLDPTDGGRSQRYAVIAEAHQREADAASSLLGYVQYYDLDLFSNFTYFLDDPVNGDQFQQSDRRVMAGLDGRHTWFGELFDRPSNVTLGLQARTDYIHNGLYHTTGREQLSTTRQDKISETSFGVFLQNETRWTDWFRSTVGVRGDFYYFNVDSQNTPANSGDDFSAIASPKGSLVFGPFVKTEIYLSGVLGFHSNDARGVLTTVDVGGSGDALQSSDALVRTEGAEFGIRTNIIPGLQSTISVWTLYSDSELLFVGDAGTTEASRPSRREGIEFANFYKLNDWLTIDADYSLSRARFTDSDPSGNRIPGSIEQVVAAGITFADPNPDHGFFGSLRLRYFGPRPLIEDDSIRSGDSTLVNMEVGYRFNPDLTLRVEVLNLFDNDVSDIEYYYASRLPGEGAGPDDGGFNDVHLHPAEPLAVRVGLTYRF